MTPSGSPRIRAAATLAVASALVIGTSATAGARPVSAAVLAPDTQFTMQADGTSGVTAKGAQIPNIDSVKSTIRTYYGAGSNGIANKTASPYISELADIQADTLAALPAAGPDDAIVFDADDTTLWTYDMEDAAMHFNFDPVLQNTWVQEKRFPATPGMVDFVDAVQAKGYDVYGLTGRGASQEDATLGNLTDVGYSQFNGDNFFTKFDATSPKPNYLDCHTGVDPVDDPTKCTTVEYKAGTRKHIEAPVEEGGLGKNIVLNIGDQWSDLQGGFSDATLKLPNPTYYLPSPNITGAPAGDSDLTPRTEFTMAPDGSSGATEGGEGIPNIDSVKSTIRTYYGAVNGIANKTDSPYISELTEFTTTWADKLRHRCATGRDHREKPAVVFDADDTTLWTYDMEDAAMKFNFDPVLQNTWVQEGRFPATPGMPMVVRAAQKAGCTIVGLTGRKNDQRQATLDNLASVGYTDKKDEPLFQSQFYFTKWTSSQTPPAYVDCSTDGNPASCSTIDYKASTRKYAEEHFGFHIVANLGDQFSDLIGGHADEPVKLPNPTYYLP